MILLLAELSWVHRLACDRQFPAMMIMMDVNDDNDDLADGENDHDGCHEDGDHNHDHHDDVLKYDDGDNLGFCRLTTNLIIMRMMVLIMEIMMIMAMLATKRK